MLAQAEVAKRKAGTAESTMSEVVNLKGTAQPAVQNKIKADEHSR